MSERENFSKKGLSALLMFVIGFAAFSILGAVALFVLISFGFLPAI